MKINLKTETEKVQAWWEQAMAGSFSTLIEESEKSGATFSSHLKETCEKVRLTNWGQAVENLKPNFSIPSALKEDAKATTALKAAMAQEVRLDCLGYHLVLHFCEVLRIKTRKGSKQFNTEELFSLPEVMAWETMTYQQLQEKIVAASKLKEAAERQAAEGNVRPRRVPKGVELL